MSLYRKYRPKNFTQVFGQDHIVKTLINQISSGSVSHAYLFCGTRGTGKTSIARLLARALNCQNVKDNISVNESQPIPCNKCESCSDILQNRSTNVIEIDAASNNGVDNIRDILEKVHYPPVAGTHKIYIIDEVHMLSTGAFNALLKTLEEPPAHVVFVLATTDPHKVLPTVHSRCQRFEFKRISATDIAENIAPFLDQENAVVEPPALALIARLADGSVRDALSLADQALSFYSGQQPITEENIRNLVGSVDTATLFEITDALLIKNSLTTIEIIHNMSQGGKDYAQFVGELIAHFRNLLVSSVVNKPNQVLDVSAETLKKLVDQSNKGNISVFGSFIESFTELLPKLKNEKNPKILLELTCLKLCTQKPQIENQREPQREPQREEQREPRIPNVTEQKPKQPQELQNTGLSWTHFVNQQDSILKALLANCEFKQSENTLYIQSGSDITFNILMTKEQEISGKIDEFAKQKIELKITKHKETEAQPQSGLTQAQQQEMQQKIKMPIEFK